MDFFKALTNTNAIESTHRTHVCLFILSRAHNELVSIRLERTAVDTSPNAMEFSGLYDLLSSNFHDEWSLFLQRFYLPT